jgi:hypothetical protein
VYDALLPWGGVRAPWVCLPSHIVVSEECVRWFRPPVQKAWVFREESNGDTAIRATVIGGSEPAMGDVPWHLPATYRACALEGTVRPIRRSMLRAHVLAERRNHRIARDCIAWCSCCSETVILCTRLERRLCGGRNDMSHVSGEI